MKLLTLLLHPDWFWIRSWNFFFGSFLFILVICIVRINTFFSTKKCLLWMFLQGVKGVLFCFKWNKTIWMVFRTLRNNKVVNKCSEIIIKVMNVYYQRVKLSFFLAARSYFEIENKVCNVKTYNYYIARIAVGGGFRWNTNFIKYCNWDTSAELLKGIFQICSPSFFSLKYFSQ